MGVIILGSDERHATLARSAIGGQAALPAVRIDGRTTQGTYVFAFAFAFAFAFGSGGASIRWPIRFGAPVVSRV